MGKINGHSGITINGKKVVKITTSDGKTITFQKKWEDWSCKGRTGSDHQMTTWLTPQMQSLTVEQIFDNWSIKTVKPENHNLTLADSVYDSYFRVGKMVIIFWNQLPSLPVKLNEKANRIAIVYDDEIDVEIDFIGKE